MIPPALSKQSDRSSSTCSVIALWLFAGGSAVWAYVVGLANTSTQGYAMSKQAVMLAYAPGAAVFLLSILLLVIGIRAKRFSVAFFLALPPAALCGILFIMLVAGLLGARM